MSNALTAPTQTLAVTSAHPNKLRVLQSNAYDLAANNNSDEEIKRACTALGASLHAAIAEHREEIRPVSDLSEQELAVLIGKEITGFTRLTCGSWDQVSRQEFVDQVIEEIFDLPVSLILPAIQRARRTVHQPQRFIPWIFEEIDKRLCLLQDQDKIFRKLALIGERR